MIDTGTHAITITGAAEALEAVKTAYSEMIQVARELNA